MYAPNMQMWRNWQTRRSQTPVDFPCGFKSHHLHHTAIMAVLFLGGDFLELNNKLSNINNYPFHMPGHKRNQKFGICSSEIDITEIDGFDNLHNPKNMLLELEKRYANEYHSKKSFLSVNGSTCCILAAISAICKPNDKIIIARNCHKSVYNACFINRLQVEYIMPSIDDDFNCFNAITQYDIDTAIKKNPNAKAIVITSPTYEGIISNIVSPIPLIIDAAHGAHFGFNKNFPSYPKADIVISSLHKTLPALTQTAIINVYNNKYTTSVKKYMDIYESSSPSYVLLNSIDICCDYLNNSKSDFDDLFNYCNELITKIKNNLSTIQILKNDDISRLCIKSTKLNGNVLADELRYNHNIEVEMSCTEYIILILTVGDDKEAYSLLYTALEKIDCKYRDSNNYNYKKIVYPQLPKKNYEVYEISKTKISNLNDSINCICGEYIFAYPPGIPIIVPGEIITQDLVDFIDYSIKANTNIISENGILNHKILTKC